MDFWPFCWQVKIKSDHLIALEKELEEAKNLPEDAKFYDSFAIGLALKRFPLPSHKAALFDALAREIDKETLKILKQEQARDDLIEKEMLRQMALNTEALAKMDEMKSAGGDQKVLKIAFSIL